MLHALLLVGPLAMAETPSLPTTPGIHALERAVGEATVRFTLSLPKGLEAGVGAEVPVVLALHYAGHGAPHYAKPFVEQLVAPGLAKLGAIIVAPDCPGSSWTAPGVEDTVLALLDQIVAETRGDPARVVVTGYSMGGMGTWAFALRHPERFVAAVPVAGRPRRGAPVTVPVYAIHGARDELIDVAPTRQAIDALRKAGREAHIDVVAELTHYEVPSYAPSLAEAVPWLKARLKP
ncbi:MAG: alpha/beta fold hydrolase [Myxococcota bacterium]